MDPFRLRPFFSERVWGKRSLAPWFAETGTTELVGEAWLTGPQCIAETGEDAGKPLEAIAAAQGAALLGEGGEREFPLLVKMLFPNEKLSVQVHPDDAKAQAMGQPRGKTECWYVLDAEPGAAVMLGLQDGIDAAAVERGISEGTLEAMLRSVPVTAGDMIFVDAGTVHAIGPGVVLLETQQTSDTTFRLFDYGRPRELHVRQGIDATKLTTRAGKVAPQAMDGFTRLIEERYFTVDRFHGPAEVEMAGPGCLVGLAGGLSVVNNRVQLDMPAGRAVVVAAGGKVQVQGAPDAVYLRCMAPVGGAWRG